MCKDAVGVHPHVLIHTSDAMREKLHKAICGHFKIQYAKNQNGIKVSPKMKIYVHANEPFSGFGGGLMILFHPDESFDHCLCVAPLLNGSKAETALCMFRGDRVIVGKEDVLKEFTSPDSKTAARSPQEDDPKLHPFLQLVLFLFVSGLILFFSFYENSPFYESWLFVLVRTLVLRILEIII